jgi:hypothetical protein
MGIHYPIMPRFIAPQAILDPSIFRSDIVAFAGGKPNVRWERAFPCPCSARSTFVGDEGEIGGEPADECPACNNTGTYFVRQPDTFAVHTSATDDPKHRMKVTGEGWSDGTIELTFLPENAPGHLDRVTLLNAWIRVAERRVRRRTKEALRFPLEARPIVSADPNNPSQTILTHEDIIEIAWADTAGRYRGRLERGADWAISSEGLLDWTPGDRLDLPEPERSSARSAPPLRCQYVVSYWVRPRYIVTSIPFVHRPDPTQRPGQIEDGGGTPRPTDMPVHCTAQLEIVGDRKKTENSF